MQIPFLSFDPAEIPRQLCDQHLKLSIEAAQLLATAYKPETLRHRLPPKADGTPRRVAWQNHPAAIWARSNPATFRWLANFGAVCEIERRFRGFREIPSLESFFEVCLSGEVPPDNLSYSGVKGVFFPEDGFIPADAIARRYIHPHDFLPQRYRLYYRFDKEYYRRNFTRRPKPWWSTCPIDNLVLPETLSGKSK